MKEIISDDLIFEDPAARCKSREEVKNAFKMLKYITPVNVSRNLHVINEDKAGGHRKVIVFDQLQQYTIGKKLVLHSHVLVDVDTRQQKVLRIEERWNGHKLLNISYPSRIINGIISDFVIRAFLKAASTYHGSMKKD